MKKKPELKKSPKSKKSMPKTKVVKTKAKPLKKAKLTKGDSSANTPYPLLLPKGTGKVKVTGAKGTQKKVKLKKSEAVPVWRGGSELSKSAQKRLVSDAKEREEIWKKIISVLQGPNISPIWVSPDIDYMVIAKQENLKVVKSMDNSFFQPYEKNEVNSYCTLVCIRIYDANKDGPGLHPITPLPEDVLKLVRMGCPIITVQTLQDVLSVLMQM